MNYYFLCFIISWILSILYFIKWKKGYSTFITLSFITGIITNFGYWQQSISSSLDRAVLANDIIYTGASFNTILLLFSILDVCKIDLKKSVKMLLLSFNLFIYSTSLTAGFNDLFYKKVYLRNVHGATVLGKEYGVIHIWYYVMLGVDFIIGLIGVIYTIKKKRDVSMINVILLLICNFMSIAAFAVGRLLGTLDAVPLDVVVVLLFYSIVSDRFALYDVDTTAGNTFGKKDSVGIVNFDFQHKYLGCNAAARRFFPELCEMRVDTVTSNMRLLRWLEESEKEENWKIDIERGEKCYTIESRHLLDGNKIRGIQFIIEDCTDEVKYERDLKYAAITDEMTHLMNRRAFEEELEQIEKNSIKENLVLISFDLNGLKNANDSIGHYAGDELICAAAEVIESTVSEIGHVYRIGGDEFTAIVYSSILDLKKRLCEFENKCKNWRGKYTDVLSISKGYAAQIDDLELGIYDLVKEADKQMYRDKAMYYQEHNRRKN